MIRDPEKRRISQQRYYQSNKRREWRKTYRTLHKDQIREYSKKYRLEHPGDRNLITRQIFIEKMGGKCSNPDCGFSDWRALQIDHVNGGGEKERRNTSTVLFRKRVLEDKTGKYQLLCSNCNWIKRYEKKEYQPIIPKC